MPELFASWGKILAVIVTTASFMAVASPCSTGYKFVDKSVHAGIHQELDSRLRSMEVRQADIHDDVKLILDHILRSE
jgi:hypothetical protein